MGEIGEEFHVNIVQARKLMEIHKENSEIATESPTNHVINAYDRS